MVSIIIINYRQKDYLQNCIKSIYDKIKSYPFEVIIINNSPEENLNFLKTDFSSLKIIENENKGFSNANNLGAKNTEGDYLLFLNADTIIKTDFLLNFINSFKDKPFGVTGLKLYNPDETFQLSFWKENTFFNEVDNKKAEKLFRKRNINYITETESEYNNISEVEWVSGAAMVMKKDVFEKIGGFDERYFLFYEDADICKRLKNNGLKIYFYPFCKIIHFKGENINEEFKNSTYYHSKLSQLLYYKIHNPVFQRIILRFYLFIKFTILTLVTFKKINIKILKLSLGIKND